MSRLLFAAALALILAPSGNAAPPVVAPAVKSLMRTTLSGDESKAAIVATGVFAPGATTGRHTHPGDEYATVLEGELEILTDGQPPKRVRAGEAYHNARDVIHETRNVGEVAAKVVSTFVIDKNQPIMKPSPP